MKNKRGEFFVFIINLKYLLPIEKIEEVKDEHIEFLKKYYEKSIFLASGPKVPRTGGIILANGVKREELNLIIREDPFFIKQIAEYEITEFIPSMHKKTFIS